MAQGLRPHHHFAVCYVEFEYDDYERGVHVRKCLMYCPICKMELKPEYYYSQIKAPPRAYKSNKALKRNQRKYGNHR